MYDKIICKMFTHKKIASSNLCTSVMAKKRKKINGLIWGYRSVRQIYL